MQRSEKAMQNYLKWLKDLPSLPVFVACSAAFDFMFVYWYLIRFTGESSFSHSALDIKTFAMAMLKKPYRESVRKICLPHGSMIHPIPCTGFLVIRSELHCCRSPFLHQNLCG
jgi:hypothetical protein